MKNNLTILFFLFSVSLTFAQDSSLIGAYRLDLERSVESMEVMTRNKYDSLPTDVRSRAANSMETRRFVFHADGQLEVSWGADAKATQANGTWVIQDGVAVRLALNVSGDVKEYLIAERSNDHLLLKNTQGTGLFNNIYLVKID